MKKTWVIALIVVVVSALSVCCLQKPTVEVGDITVTSISPSSTTVDVEITIDNPNPLGATLDSIVFDAYRVDGGEEQFLAHGEKLDQTHIRANGESVIAIPATVSNSEALQVLYEYKVQGKPLTLKLVGSVSLNLKITSVTIPFDTTRTIS
jgi:LEA14-like dessication related protein